VTDCLYFILIRILILPPFSLSLCSLYPLEVSRADDGASPLILMIDPATGPLATALDDEGVS
jgi:hypothetical protein